MYNRLYYFVGRFTICVTEKSYVIRRYGLQS